MANTEKSSRQLLTEAERAAVVKTHGDYRHALDMWSHGTPEYEEAEEELVRMANHNPRLFTKIVNRD